MERKFNNEEKMTRGQIYMVDLGIREGNLQSKMRPCVIWVNNKACEVSPVLTVVPISGQLKALHLPTHLFMKKGTGNLKEDSVLLAEQITTVNRSQVKFYVGEVSKRILDKIKTAVEIAQGTNEEKEKFNYNHIHMKIEDINSLINMFRISPNTELSRIIKNQIDEVIEYCERYDVDHTIYTSQYNLKTKDNLRKVV